MSGIYNHSKSSETAIDRQRNSESNDCLNVRSWTAYFSLYCLFPSNTGTAYGYSDHGTEITLPQSSIEGPFVRAKNNPNIELSPKLTTKPEKPRGDITSLGDDGHGTHDCSTYISEMTNLGEVVSKSPRLLSTELEKEKVTALECKYRSVDFASNTMGFVKGTNTNITVGVHGSGAYNNDVFDGLKKQNNLDATGVLFDAQPTLSDFGSGAASVLTVGASFYARKYADDKLMKDALGERLVGASYYHKEAYSAANSARELTELTVDIVTPAATDVAVMLAHASVPTMGAAALASTGHNILEATNNFWKARDAEHYYKNITELDQDHELVNLLKDQSKSGLTEKKSISYQKCRIYLARTPLGLVIFGISAAAIAAGSIASLGTPLILIGGCTAATYLVLEGVRFKEAYTQKQNLCHVKAVTEAYNHMNNPTQQYKTFLEKINEEFDRKYVSKSTKYRTIVKRGHKRKIRVFKPNTADKNVYKQFKSRYDKLIEKLETVDPLKEIKEVKQEVEKEIKDLELIACSFLAIKPEGINKRELQSQLDTCKKAIDHMKFRQRTTYTDRLSKSNLLQYFVKCSSSFHDPYHGTRKEYEEHYKNLVKKVNNGTCEQSEIDSHVKELSDYLEEHYLKTANYQGQMLTSPARFGEKSLARTIVNKLIDTETTQEDRANLVMFCSSLLTDSEKELFSQFFKDLNDENIPLHETVLREILVKKRQRCMPFFQSKTEPIKCSNRLVDIIASKLQSS